MRSTRWLATLLLGLATGTHAQASDVIVEACVGPSGELRLAGADGCRPAERPFAWQRGGGVWVHDANGRPLGRSMDRDLFWIHVDATGLRVALSAHSGLPLGISSFIGFTERDCQGVAVGSRRQNAGDVIAHGLRDLLFVGTERILAS